MNPVDEFLASGGKIKYIPIGQGSGVEMKALYAGEKLTNAQRERIKQREKETPLGPNLTMDTGRSNES